MFDSITYTRTGTIWYTKNQRLLTIHQSLITNTMTLTDTAFYTRSAIKYGTLLIIFLIIGRIFWSFGYSIYLRVFPPPPPAPTVIFGRLPTLSFPQKEASTLSFVLQTPTGELPALPVQSNVYLMPQTTVSFLALEESVQIARQLGFTGTPVELSQTIYRFEKPNTPATLEMNIVNKSFSLNYRLGETPTLLSTRPRSTEEALSAVRSYLSQASLLTPDLSEGTHSFEFQKVQPPSLTSVLSLSDANFIRVNLFRKKYDELPVLTPYKNSGNVWFLVSGSTNRDTQIVAGEYHYFPVDETRKSTYPLKSASVAFDELKAGKAYSVTTPAGALEKVVVRRVYLAYYDSGRPQGFMQPVVVFEGDDYLGYVPAVTNEYYGSKPEGSEATNSGQAN